jgi:hypothetical protein
MRHSAALAMAHVETVAFAENSVKDAHVKLLGGDEIIDRNDEVIERLSDGHDKLLQ